MSIIIDNAMRIPLGSVTPEQLERIQAGLTFRNPAYAEAMARLRAQGRGTSVPYDSDGRPIWKFIRGWRVAGGNLIVPRGCASEVMDILGLGLGDVAVRTRRLPPTGLTFRGELKPAQEPAMQAVLGRRFGCLDSPTGSGKTVMGLYAIAARQQPALVVVHLGKLVNQWVERAEQFLGLGREEVGIIGQDQWRIGKALTIALVQTLHKCAGEVAPHVGHLVVDECHHCPATTFTQAVSRFDSAYMLGLSATHRRADGLTPLIYWYLGPLVYSVPRSVLLRDGVIVEVEPVFRETGWTPDDEMMRLLELRTEMAAAGYKGEEIEVSKDDRKAVNTAQASLVAAMTRDQGRNEMIAADVAAEAANGPCIVLTDRKSHAEELARLVAARGVRVEYCHGGVKRQRQEEIVRALNEGGIRVLVGTGQLLGEGFDCKALAALFLATPIKFSGRLEQYLGRVARGADGKLRARVYDYVDQEVPTLMRAARERMRAYRRLARQARGPTRKIK